MVSLEHARSLCLERLSLLPSELVPLDECPGRVLRQEVRAKWPLPVHDHAAMDGFAFRSSDTLDASEQDPVRLEVDRAICAGDASGDALEPGHAVRVFTGARIPPGVDCVLRQEMVERVGASIIIAAPVPVGHDLRRRGEDIDQHELLVGAGETVDAEIVMALASFGHDQVKVTREPRVTILTTGDELYPVGQATPERVVDTVGPTLAAACRLLGARVQLQPRVDDDAAALQLGIERALDGSPDLLLTVGGASVGARDLVTGTLQKQGVEWAFRGIRLRPGKPAGFGTIGTVPVFMLPGNPGAALAVFRCLVEPALEHLSGRCVGAAGDARRGKMQVARLAHAIPRDPTRSTLLHVDVVRHGHSDWVKDTHPHSSAQIGPRIRSNASLVVGPGDTPMQAGSIAAVRLRSNPPLQSDPPVICFIGLSNSGKTTLIESIVSQLAKTVEVAVIKHGRHFSLDRPGKDSARFRDAGARVVAVSGPKLTATMHRPLRPATLPEMLSGLPPGLDIVLVEGFKHEGLPSIEVHRRGRELLCSHERFGHVEAVVTDEPDIVPPGLPSFRHGEVASVIEFIRSRVHSLGPATSDDIPTQGV